MKLLLAELLSYSTNHHTNKAKETSFKMGLHLSNHLFSNVLVLPNSTSQRHASVVVINNIEKLTCKQTCPSIIVLRSSD